MEEKASAALGRKVDLGGLNFSVWGRALSAETLAVADDLVFSTLPFLTAKSVKVVVELWPLLVALVLGSNSTTTGCDAGEPPATISALDTAAFLPAAASPLLGANRARSSSSARLNSGSPSVEHFES
jgi:hypothetical protein